MRTYAGHAAGTICAYQNLRGVAYLPGRWPARIAWEGSQRDRVEDCDGVFEANVSDAENEIRSAHAWLRRLGIRPHRPALVLGRDHEISADVAFDGGGRGAVAITRPHCWARLRAYGP